MIYLSNIKDTVAQNYSAEPSINPFSTRVKSLLTAYGDYPNLLDFWYQENDDNIITAYIVRYGGEFIADIMQDSDKDEILNLCKIAGGTVLMCKDILYSNNKGIVMKLGDLISRKVDITILDNVNLEEYYKIISQNASASFPLPNFDEYYVDLCHRLRKGTADIAGAYINNQLISCCVATAIDNNSAVISGVATLPAYKRQGYATAVVTYMCNKLIKNCKENIYLQRAVNENYHLYNNIGFEDFSVFEQIILTDNT